MYLCLYIKLYIVIKSNIPKDDYFILIYDLCKIQH
jgi:hypothetical protein